MGRANADRMKVLGLVLFCLAVACGKPERPAPAGGNDALRCNSDHDCVSPCGPCDPGATITETAAMAECVVNPCPNNAPMCAPNHTCVVGNKPSD